MQYKILPKFTNLSNFYLILNFLLALLCFIMIYICNDNADSFYSIIVAVNFLCILKILLTKLFKKEQQNDSIHTKKII